MAQRYYLPETPFVVKIFIDKLKQPNKIYLIGMHDGEIIAQSNLTIRNEYEKTAHVGQIGIAIHKDYQDQGLGTQLITCLEKLGKERGLEKIEISAFSDNTRAIHVYRDKLGYEWEGTRKDGIKFEDGTCCDEIMLGKSIK